MAFSYTLTNPTTYYFVNQGSYLESNNKGIKNSYALSVINFTIPAGETYHLYLDCISWAESSCDYGIVSNINQSLSRSYTGDTDTTLVKQTFRSSNSSSTQTVDYGEISTSGTIDIKFRKDGSVNSNNDSLRVTIRAVPVQVQPAVPDISTTSLTKIFYGINKIAKMYYGTNLVFGTSGGGGGETITDLTGTTWTFNENLNISPLEEDYYEFNINYYLTNDLEVSDIKLELYSDIDYFEMDYSNIAQAYNSSLDGWQDDNFKSITITGGTDATNSDLIAWLQANATQQTQPEPQPVAGSYLTFSSPSSFTLNVVDNIKYWNGSLEYSTDLSNWNTWSGTSAISSSSSGTTKYLYLRGSGNTYITGSSASNTKAKWVLTGSNISCSGSIENLLDYQTVANGNSPTMADYCYYNLFRNNTSLTTAPSLPATTLASRCYSYMFYNCTSLTIAPSLSATTLASNCYSYMFQNCSSLTTAPSLPATTLATYCYYQMFYGCTSLTTAPSLPATTLANYCYYAMFRGCTALTTAPSLPANTLKQCCYYAMFQGCTSLITAPSLPATTLIETCYYQMFYGCTSLTTAPALPATTLVTYCYYQMFYGCTALTTAPSLPANTLKNYCYYQMFYNCSSLATPAIMAGGTTQATPAHLCCYQMYYGCTTLNIYTSSSNHIAFYYGLTYSTSPSDTNYQSSYRMFYNCYIDGTQSTADYLTAGTQYYY